MGLARAGISLLIREGVRRPWTGRVVTLGRQHVYITSDELAELARIHGYRLTDARLELHRQPELAARNFLSDGCLLKRLGFTEIIRTDVSAYEDCDLILDLNAAETPPELTGRFDLVLDSGTMEHVFDLPAVLRHCCRMVRPDGRVVHITPSSNCVEHGFYSVSPTLFADFYSASGFRLDDVLLCRIPLDLPRGSWDVYDYLNSPIRPIPLGMLDDRIWFTMSVATAIGEVSPRVPQQSLYEQTWQAAAQLAGQSQTSNSVAEESTKAGQLLKSVAFSPFLTRIAQKLIATRRDFVNNRRIRKHIVPYQYLGRF